MKKILVATDGSDISTRAVALAADLAKQSEATLSIAHSMVPLMTELPAGAYRELEQAQRESAALVLRRAAEVAARPGLELRTVLLKGPPAQALVEEAEGQGYDLLVIGSHGRGAVARVLLGSVAGRVVRLCHCPVMVTR